MSIDKVVIQGAEFTRVADRYLLQSEVEAALAQRSAEPLPHLDRLTRLLEDIVNTADAVALEVLESMSLPSTADDSESREGPARVLLQQVRDEMHDQVLAIDSFMQRLES